MSLKNITIEFKGKRVVKAVATLGGRDGHIAISASSIERKGISDSEAEWDAYEVRFGGEKRKEIADFKLDVFVTPLRVYPQ